MVTADELPDPQGLELETRVNGEVMQDSSTAQLIFGVDQLHAVLDDLLQPAQRRALVEHGDDEADGHRNLGEGVVPPRDTARHLHVDEPFDETIATDEFLA